MARPRRVCTRTYLIIVCAMRCGQNGMAARREAAGISGIWQGRVTQRTPVLAATRRDGRLRPGTRSAGAGADAQAPLHHRPRSRFAPLPAPLCETPGPGRIFAPGVVARSEGTSEQVPRGRDAGFAGWMT